MRIRMLKFNKLYNLDCREGLALLDDESIDCCISSPPYWSLRDYGIEPTIWDGDPDCDHEFEEVMENQEGYNNTRRRWQHGATRDDEPETWNPSIKSYGFCIKCGAWKGCLGLEPNIDLFIKHLCDIYDLIKQKLRKTGTCWVNLGDTYSQGGRSGSKKYFENGHKQFGKNDPKGKYQAPLRVKGFPPKTLLMIPERFAIEMLNRGWILRNVIIWKKNNPMPESAKDRFTRNYEYLYFFVKSSKTQYYINEKSGLSLDKLPKERVENIDWEWRPCNKCNGIGIIKTIKKTKLIDMNKWTGSPRAKYQNKSGPCKKCKGTGRIKHNLWSGKDYWFDQNIIRQPIKDDPKTYLKKITRKHNFSKGNALQSGMASKENGFNDHLKNNEIYVPNVRNRRCVWTINTKPNPESHFATFPLELVEIPIKSGCPEWVCDTCGKPRERIYERIFTPRDQLPKDHRDYRPNSQYINEDSKHLNETSNMVHPTGGKLGKGWGRITDIKPTILGKCECNSNFKSGIVLDPFAGTGTTLRKAFKLGRDFIGFEISKEYCKIANIYLSKETNFKRITDFISKAKMEDSA